MQNIPTRARRGLRATLLSAVLLALLPAAARAATVNVDCDAVAPPPGAFNSINAALATLDNIGPHTVNVTGFCAEAVNVFQRERLMIQAAPGPATISPPAPGPNVMTVNGSHNII